MRSTTEEAANEKWCNCRGRKNDNNICPLNGYCLKANKVYRADITSNGVERTYVGSTGNTFKARYALHKASLTHRKHGNPTALSTFYWEEKENGNNPTIKWSIVKEVRGKFSPKNGCPICNTERVEIARSNQEKLLNTRNELKSNCPHHRKRFFATKDYEKTDKRE